ncbi:hypothetical protein Clacol_004029 [Clathrus columnatus]|uniref:Uncharacterized protein n=1 Tax=Clathrus columnatus TaxID=1419009 RepID=A0AAV5AD12_9AGAM|nr:hypothetical protein Clacol_004029 [Clathrus columnatus]
MLNFWTRRANKPSTGQKTENVLPLSKLDTTSPVDESAFSHLELPSEDREFSQTVPSNEPQESQEQAQSQPQPIPEPYIAATPNPHDSAISEIRNGLRQVESLARPQRSTNAVTEQSPSGDTPTEPLYDPATGEQRGTFDKTHPASPADSAGPFDNVTAELTNDEVWSHLARIRELQSEIAKMHTHMEGVGDTKHVLDIDVDVDIDVDSVPTQEEEEAAKRQKEFEKLPRRFKGRSENIEAVMTKLDELSKTVMAFHALQPPPLNFKNTISEEIIDDNPPSSPSLPVNIRNTQISLPSSVLGPRTTTRNQFSSEVMHDSPTSFQSNFIH